MTEIQIYVRKIYQDPKEFKGRNYTEYKLYATSGLYYTSNKSFDPKIEEGSEVLLDAEPTKNPKYFKIKEIKAFNFKKLPTNPVSLGRDKSAQAGPATNQSQTPPPAGQLPPIPKPTTAQRVEWIDTALATLKKAGIDAEIESSLLTELVRQQHSEWMSDRIERLQKARWGK